MDAQVDWHRVRVPQRDEAHLRALYEATAMGGALSFEVAVWATNNGLPVVRTRGGEPWEPFEAFEASFWYSRDLFRKGSVNNDLSNEPWIYRPGCVTSDNSYESAFRAWANRERAKKR